MHGSTSPVAVTCTAGPRPAQQPSPAPQLTTCSRLLFDCLAASSAARAAEILSAAWTIWAEGRDRWGMAAGVRGGLKCDLAHGSVPSQLAPPAPLQRTGQDSQPDRRSRSHLLRLVPLVVGEVEGKLLHLVVHLARPSVGLGAAMLASPSKAGVSAITRGCGRGEVCHSTATAWQVGGALLLLRHWRPPHPPAHPAITPAARQSVRPTAASP